MPEISEPTCIATEGDEVRRDYLRARLADLTKAVDDKDADAGRAVVDRMERQGFIDEAEDLVDWLACQVIAEKINGQRGALMLVGLVAVANSVEQVRNGPCQCESCRSFRLDP